MGMLSRHRFCGHLGRPRGGRAVFRALGDGPAAGV